VRSDGGRVFLEAGHLAGERLRESRGRGEAVARQLHRWIDERAPRLRAVLAMRIGESRHRARDADREMTLVVFLVRVVTGRVEKHLLIRGERRLLAEID